MTLEDLALLSRRERVRMIALVLALIVAVVWASVHYLQPAPPRRIVLASLYYVPMWIFYTGKETLSQVN
jgi:hypothetical protein